METSNMNLTSSQEELMRFFLSLLRPEGCVVALAQVAGWTIRGISYSVTDRTGYSHSEQTGSSRSTSLQALLLPVFPLPPNHYPKWKMFSHTL